MKNQIQLNKRLHEIVASEGLSSEFKDFHAKMSQKKFAMNNKVNKIKNMATIGSMASSLVAAGAMSGLIAGGLPVVVVGGAMAVASAAIASSTPLLKKFNENIDSPQNVIKEFLKDAPNKIKESNSFYNKFKQSMKNNNLINKIESVMGELSPKIKNDVSKELKASEIQLKTDQDISFLLNDSGSKKEPSLKRDKKLKNTI